MNHKVIPSKSALNLSQQPSLSSNMIRLIDVITSVLEEICKETDQEDDMTISIYHSSRRPTISLNDYLQRIAKYSHCGEECYVFALIYIDRLQEFNPEIVMNSQSVHRMILITTIVAVKFHEDEYYKNDYYAKVGGIMLEELNSLESQLLLHLNYKLIVDDQTFKAYTSKLQMFAEL